MRAFSSSSDTSTQEEKEDLIMLMTRSLDRTSSFFTWSPVTFVLPAIPYLPGGQRSSLMQLSDSAVVKNEKTKYLCHHQAAARVRINKLTYLKILSKN